VETCGSLVFGEKGQFKYLEADAGLLVSSFDGEVHCMGVGWLMVVEQRFWAGWWTFGGSTVGRSMDHSFR